MTNYNERLDEILDIPNITRMAKEKGGDVSDIDKHIQLRIVFYDGKHETYPTTLSYDLVKQAITSLIKELVAEAKPKIDLLDIGVLTGGTIALDKLGRKNIHAPKDEKKFADSGAIEAHQAAYMVAYKLSSDIFEQNLLKAFSNNGEAE